MTEDDDDDDGSREAGQFLIPATSLLPWGQAPTCPMTQDDDDWSGDAGTVPHPGSKLARLGLVRSRRRRGFAQLRLCFPKLSYQASPCFPYGWDAWPDRDGGNPARGARLPCPALSPALAAGASGPGRFHPEISAGPGRRLFSS